MVEIKLCGGKETNLNRIHAWRNKSNDMPSQKMLKNRLILTLFYLHCVRNRTVGLSESVQRKQ
jgi:hypothetical protein